MFRDIMKCVGSACYAAMCLLAVEAMDSTVEIKAACDYVKSLSFPTREVVSSLERVPAIDRNRIPGQLWNEIVDDSSKIEAAIFIGKAIDTVANDCIESIMDRSESVSASITRYYTSFWSFTAAMQFAALALLYQYTNVPTIESIRNGEAIYVSCEESNLAGALFVYLFKQLIDNRLH